MRGIALVAAWVAIGCGGGSVAPTPRPAPAASEQPCETPFGGHPSFAVDPDSLRDRGAPAALLERLRASPYRYFRGLAAEFAARSCERVAAQRWHLPLVAVHGDAHLEQFVVTNETYGIEDFDRAGFGPAIVDLVRFAASLHLACREASFECDSSHAVAAYFRAYREALDRSPDRGPTPAVVERIRREAPTDRAAWLAWTDSMTTPLEGRAEALVRARWERFTEDYVRLHEVNDAAIVEPLRFGLLQMGIGSALERKLLIRVRGASDAPDDDLVLEARSVSRPNGRDCAWRPPHGGTLHSLMLMSILGRRMPELYGFVAVDDDPSVPAYWVQSWEPGYHELGVADLHSQAELEEIAVDVAHQLAGHFWINFPEPLRANERLAQLEAFDLIDEAALELAYELSEEVVVEWNRFRALR